MGNFYNKYFRKHECIRFILINENHKLMNYYLIPEAETITINNQAYRLDKDNFYIDKKGFITYIGSTKTTAVVNIHNVLASTISPEMLAVGINSKVASEILNAVKPKVDIALITIIMLFVMVVGFGFLWYTITTELKTLYDLINGG